jgi:hypothetical protein
MPSKRLSADGEAVKENRPEPRLNGIHVLRATIMPASMTSQDESSFKISLVSASPNFSVVADVSFLDSGYLVATTVFAVVQGAEISEDPDIKGALLKKLDKMYRDTLYDFAALVMRPLAALVARPPQVPLETPTPQLVP